MKKLIFSLFLLTIILAGCKKTSSSPEWTTVNNGLAFPNGIYLPSTLAVQGTNVYAVTPGGVYLSTNKGSSWATINKGFYSDQYGSDSTNISTIAVNGNRVYAGTNNGTNVIYLLSNNGTSWTAIDNGFLPFYDNVSSIVFVGSNVYAVVFEGGVFETSNNGTSWAGVNNGLGDDSLSVFKLAVLGNNMFAGIYGGASVYLSTNNGANWTATANSGLPAKGYVNTMAVQGNNNIYVSICGTNTFGKGTIGLYLSNNNGSSWTAVNNGFLNSYTNAIPVITTLLVNGNNIYAGTHYAGVFLSTNNGNSWSPMNNGFVNNNAVFSLVLQGNNIFASTEEGVSIYPLAQ